VTCPCHDTFTVESEDESGRHATVYCLRCGRWVRDEEHAPQRPLYEAETLGAMEDVKP
jgi:hypothetical protein